MESPHNSVLLAGRKIARAFLLDAIKNNATDIHLEPDLWGMKVRYRIDGTMRDIMDLPADYQPSVIKSLKEDAHMDMLLKEIPQEGKIRLTAGKEEHLFIASSLPVIYGERMVMHLVRHHFLEQTFQGLGFSPREELEYLGFLSRTSGLIIISGSLGNGRSTTALNLLKKFKESGRNCVSLEQAPTYEVKGITQIPLVMEDLTGRAQESLASLGPEVVLLDEVLNSLALHVMMDLLSEGRLVMAVTRSRNAPAAVMDLLARGMPPAMLSEHLLGALNQRLVRRICPHCSQSFEPEQTEGQPSPPEGPFFLGGGCPTCHQTGSLGRVLIAQIFSVNEFFRESLMKTPESMVWNSCAHPHDISHHSMGLAHNGIISLEEAKKVCDGQ
jgi:type II secretory ATPase GspE/PulE/Tfp pilus assembly ATPase PilB-like protein